MALDAVIFDLDGTLVDTNALHVEAWRRAFEAHGYRVEPDRIFPEVGKGTDKVVPGLLGQAAFRKHGDALSKAHPEEYGKLARRDGVKVFPGATELPAELRRRGIKTVLATSSLEGHLKVTREASGLDPRQHVDDLVTADDAEQSKPAPDLVAAAAVRAASPFPAGLPGRAQAK